MGGQYPAAYVKHHIDRLHTPGALRLLDLELSGPDEILPGIVCEAAGGHTEGSMNVNVQTADGVACICGDVIYDIQNQIVDPIYQVLDHEPQSTGNQGTSKREERAAIKKALNSGRSCFRSTTGPPAWRAAGSCPVSSATPSQGPSWP